MPNDLLANISDSGLAPLRLLLGASTLVVTVIVLRAALPVADLLLRVVATTLRERMTATAATVTTTVIAIRVTVVTLATALDLLTLGQSQCKSYNPSHANFNQ